ncbi:5408_t:CDS:2, partial [Funneliformis geosporum]
KVPTPEKADYPKTTSMSVLSSHFLRTFMKLTQMYPTSNPSTRYFVRYLTCVDEIILRISSRNNARLTISSCAGRHEPLLKNISFNAELLSNAFNASSKVSIYSRKNIFMDFLIEIEKLEIQSIQYMCGLKSM